VQVARRLDDEALRRLLLLYSTQPTNDGFAGDQTLLAPAFVATDGDLEELVGRFAATVQTVEAQVKAQMVGAAR
jgi:hypothetical protein